MSKIILSMEGMVLKTILLEKDRMTIGRRSGNDIQIDNLAISGEHAVITLEHGERMLEDLDSTNGTQVNGQPVRRHLLKNGDVIELGKYRLKYLDEALLQKGAMLGAAPSAVPHLGSSTAQSLPPSSAHARTTMGWQAGDVDAVQGASQKTLPNAAIQILSGVNAGKEMELTKTLSTLGKPGVQVAVITKRPHGYFIAHVEGKHFPIINGKAIDAQAQLLNDHDIIELTGIKMEFFFRH